MICASPRKRLPLMDMSVIGITVAAMTPMMPTTIIISMRVYPRSDLMPADAASTAPARRFDD
jgi:hypothetical protein